MKMKKLLSLMLCLSMLATAVLTTGCGKEKTDEEEEDSADSQNLELVTLNMFIVTDDSTTDRQKQAVEIAINEETIKNLKTKVNINYLSEADFWPTIDQTLLDIEKYEENKQNKKNKSKAAKVNNKSLDEIYTEMRKDGIKLDKVIASVDYSTPLVLGAAEAQNIDTTVPQIDVIVFNNYEKYYEFVNPGVDEEGKAIPAKLAPLDSYLKAESKILNSFIYPAYIEAAKVGADPTTAGKVYGIPVNGPIGTYEYIVIDKELAQKYITAPEAATAFETEEEYNEYFENYVKENYNTFPKFETFLAAVKAGEPDVIPLNKTTSPGNVEFYPAEGSPIGIVFEGTEWVKKLHSVYENESVRAHFESIYNYRQAGYIADETTPANARYAVQIIEGSSMAEAALEAEDEREYIFITYKNPKFENEKVLSGVFAISEKSYNKDRAMELIEAFNTNATLANLLQWGVEDGTSTYIPEGEDEPLEGNYKLNDDKQVVLINDGNGYKMNNNYTGNKFIKYRLEGTPDEFEGEKQQNTESWVGAFSGYSPVYNTTDEAADKATKDEINKITAYAQEYYADFLAGTGDRPFDERYDELIAYLREVNPLLAFAVHVEYNYSGPYAKFVIGLSAEGSKYQYGRIAGLQPPAEESEEVTEEAEATEETEATEEAEVTEGAEAAEEEVEAEATEATEETAE